MCGYNGTGGGRRTAGTALAALALLAASACGRDDGRGPATTDTAQLEREGHMGLTGMRERLTAVGGTVAFGGRPGEGARIDIEVPLTDGVPA